MPVMPSRMLDAHGCLYDANQGKTLPMKPHEETWTLDVHGEQEFSDRNLGAHVITPGGDGLFARNRAAVVEDWDEGDKEDVARARLAAQAPAMARLLLQTMRAADPEGPPQAHLCPFCLSWSVPEEREHHPECEAQAVLRAAGVLP